MKLHRPAPDVKLETFPEHEGVQVCGQRVRLEADLKMGRIGKRGCDGIAAPHNQPEQEIPLTHRLLLLRLDRLVRLLEDLGRARQFRTALR